MSDYLIAVTAICAVLTVCAWASDQIPDATVDAIVRRLR